jgi:hypothetical protein
LKTLIIPDIHTRFDKAEAIIRDENPDKIVFIGDYFDAFYDTLGQTQQVAEWLKNSLKEKNRIHLLGNHDLAYLDQKHMCTGFSENKLVVIKNSGVDLSKLEMYHWIDDWLCTHSGLSYEFYNAYAKSGQNVNDLLETYCSDPELKPRLYDVSPSRGGQNAFGGIVWCDHEEFVDIPDTKQIFGHTKSDQLRHVTNNKDGSEHYCIDTGLNHYGIHYSESGLMIIGESAEPNPFGKVIWDDD